MIQKRLLYTNNKRSNVNAIAAGYGVMQVCLLEERRWVEDKFFS